MKKSTSDGSEQVCAAQLSAVFPVCYCVNVPGELKSVQQCSLVFSAFTFRDINYNWKIN